MSISQSAIYDALRNVKHPYIDKDIVSLRLIRDLVIMDKFVTFGIALTPEAMDKGEKLLKAAAAAIRGMVDPQAEIDCVIVETQTRPDANRVVGQGDHELLPHVKNVIAVASGKGGVGKSTVAANLAGVLSKQGFKVGLLDADIYGPSVPTMFNIHEKPNITVRKTLLPNERYGIKLLSMGFLVEANQAMVWRGPMVTSAIKQFLTEVEWGELDYLILDLPPGTGDIQLTIVSTVPLTGAVIVSTPQQVALDDVIRGVTMFQKVNVPVLGVVENMAYFIPEDAPEKKYHIFGEGGAKAMAERLKVPFLGEIALETTIREHADKGVPISLKDEFSNAGMAYRALCINMLNSLAERNETLPPTSVVPPNNLPKRN